MSGNRRRELRNFLIVGATGRNAGKTEFACSVIRRLSERHEVVGLKVSTIYSTTRGCLRGRDGCGVCTSVAGKFDLSEETTAGSGKDTQRLLAAGARRVYWLRVKEPYLGEALAHVAELLDPDVPVVCESNGLRRVVEPGLFVMLHPEPMGTIKPSARAVLSRADRLVRFDGRTFHPDPDRVTFESGSFRLRHDATAVVLAGGRSARMGRNKAMLDVGGGPMIEQIVRMLQSMFDEVMVSVAGGEPYGFLGVPLVTDRVSNAGPLAGILSGLEAASHDSCLFVACDIPEVSPRFVNRLMRQADRHDAVVPRYADGRIEPVCAVYRKSLLPAIHEVFENGGRKIREAYAGANVYYLPVDEDESIANLNTPDEYRAYVNGRCEPGGHGFMRML